MFDGSIIGWSLDQLISNQGKLGSHKGQPSAGILTGGSRLSHTHPLGSYWKPWETTEFSWFIYLGLRIDCCDERLVY